jgi:hypothetical protein
VGTASPRHGALRSERDDGPEGLQRGSAGEERRVNRAGPRRAGDPSRVAQCWAERHTGRPQLERADLCRHHRAAARLRDQAVRDRPEGGHSDLTSWSCGCLGSPVRVRREQISRSRRIDQPGHPRVPRDRTPWSASTR